MQAFRITQRSGLLRVHMFWIPSQTADAGETPSVPPIRLNISSERLRCHLVRIFAVIRSPMIDQSRRPPKAAGTVRLDRANQAAAFRLVNHPHADPVRESIPQSGKNPEVGRYQARLPTTQAGVAEICHARTVSIQRKDTCHRANRRLSHVPARRPFRA